MPVGLHIDWIESTYGINSHIKQKWHGDYTTSPIDNFVEFFTMLLTANGEYHVYSSSNFSFRASGLRSFEEAAQLCQAEFLIGLKKGLML